MRERLTAARLARLDWAAIGRELDGRGHAVTPPLLTPAECRALGALWTEAGRFRSASFRRFIRVVNRQNLDHTET